MTLLTLLRPKYGAPDDAKKLEELTLRYQERLTVAKAKSPVVISLDKVKEHPELRERARKLDRTRRDIELASARIRAANNLGQQASQLNNIRALLTIQRQLQAMISSLEDELLIILMALTD